MLVVIIWLVVLDIAGGDSSCSLSETKVIIYIFLYYSVICYGRSKALHYLKNGESFYNRVSTGLYSF